MTSAVRASILDDAWVRACFHAGKYWGVGELSVVKRGIRRVAEEDVSLEQDTAWDLEGGAWRGTVVTAAERHSSG